MLGGATCFRTRPQADWADRFNYEAVVAVARKALQIGFVGVLVPFIFHMRSAGGRLELSATDLSKFLSCRHLTALDMAVAQGKLRRPHKRADPLLDILIQRGRDHEQEHVDRLASTGLTVVDLTALGFDNRAEAVTRTLNSMRSGADVIVQGALGHNEWFGRPDVIQRVATPSALGEWSYEVGDTKLVRETRAGTILQLSLYSEMLAVAQGSAPEHFHVVTPDPVTPVHTFRVDDYSAYFRLVRDRLRDTVRHDHEQVAQANYPEPVDYCEYCAWFARCRDRRRSDDHLSLVAGITQAQRRELEGRGVGTLTGLAGLAVPIPFKPKRGAVETYVRVREQALVQLESRALAVPAHKLRPLEGGFGLTRLPEPSPGDVFLDLEGDPFAAEGGREYLFGVVTADRQGTDGSCTSAERVESQTYRAFWGLGEREERAAFESVMHLILDRWAAHPGMHVYHYAPYEPSAFKRLMGRYATRETELDSMLRSGRFVDLYGVVRQAMHVGVERYSIKNLEPLYGFERTVALTDANRSLLVMQTALELHATHAVPAEIIAAIEGYNRDDCVSTLRLRNWLERVRAGVEAAGTPVPRPVEPEAAASEEVDERAKRVEALRARLLAKVPEVASERSTEQQGRWLLAYLLDWHRREDKATWWEYFRLRDLPEEDLIDEPQAIAGLEFIERVSVKLSKKGKPTGSVVDRYRYPLQEMEITDGGELKLKEGTWGKVADTDRVKRTIDVSKGPSQADTHPTSAFAHTFVNPKAMEESLYALADAVAADGALTAGASVSHRAFRDLLLTHPPRLRSGAFVARQPGVDFAVEIVGVLHDSTLPIQGPPGAGKTFTGAQMILALVAQGKRVGVTATSHKVIRNLLNAVHAAAVEKGTSVRLAHRVGEEDASGDEPHVTKVYDNTIARQLLVNRETDVLGGTSWLWAREDFEKAVDVLFVDEAGQMSLANVVAISRASGSLVLLGDPQQLEQPRKGSHPERVGASALEHILGNQQTIPADRGIFLPVTWRLPPSVCRFTSELYYERKLESRTGLEAQVLSGTGAFDGSGLWVVGVPHEGNRNYSEEEVGVVEDLVRQLTAQGSRWTNERGTSIQMEGKDILVVAPYNAQVNRLLERLDGSGVRVGTVDKFQGQEAPVVIYSMATSRPEDAPRGMEFLYSPNRFNVATSRARCVAILVASPALFEPECQTARQMKLANGLCRYRELASTDAHTVTSTGLSATDGGNRGALR